MFAIQAVYKDTGRERQEYDGLQVVPVSPSFRGRTMRNYSALSRRREQFLFNTAEEAETVRQKLLPNPDGGAVCESLGRVYVTA